ncbi:MAG TPA: metallophosphoesterase [Pirellulales bacterium]|nr:metallophosphoesterase [Pirellulales bacterium]
MLGDLHYEAPQDADYRHAREQVLRHGPEAVFQLGDQGGYSHCGTWQSFMEGLEFLTGFDRPFHTLIGNHDLEGHAYSTDAQAVAEWCQAFALDEPYRTIDLGEALAVCLSSTRFRANTGCCHEVYLDESQVEWLRSTLAENRQRPTFIFSHAPPLGSGLRVLQSIHLKCPNAWLNHTDRPERFIDIVNRNPQIKLWFSGHNHLGQWYRDSLSCVNQCTFVHTGVIGEVSRDGCRHSRLVEFDADGFTLSTIDHATGAATADLRHDYASGAGELLSPRVQENGAVHFAPPACPTGPDRVRIGRSTFALHRGMLVEFDVLLAAPVGVVLDGLADEQVRACGDELHIVDRNGQSRVFKANAQGRFMRIFEPNPNPPRPTCPSEATMAGNAQAVHRNRRLPDEHAR